MTGGLGLSSLLYLLGTLVVGFGLATLPTDESPRRPGVTRAGLVLLAVVAFVRVCTVEEGRSLHMETTDGHEASSARLVDRVIDEEDFSVSGARLLVTTGALREDPELRTKMSEGYERLTRAGATGASPVLATFLGIERPSAFDLLVSAPKPVRPRGAVVFLHGSGGSFRLPCFQVAEAVRALDVVTACPATGVTASWNDAAGEAIVRATLARLATKEVVLVGLSHGGIEGSLLAPRLVKDGLVRGLVLVSGADRDAPAAGVPTLVLHGTKDTTRAPLDDAQTYAGLHGAELATFDAGHFLLLVRAAEVEAKIRTFVDATLPRITP